MTLDAKALYEIVKDVPREAWPLGTIWGKDERWWLQRDNLSAGWPTYPEAAELMFEASMARWLIGKINPYPKGSRTLTIQNCGRHWHVNSTENSGSLIHALADACKASTH